MKNEPLSHEKPTSTLHCILAGPSLRTVGFKSQTHEAKGAVPVTTVQPWSQPGQKQSQWVQHTCSLHPCSITTCVCTWHSVQTLPRDQEGILPSSDQSSNKENEKEGYKLKCKNPSIVRQAIPLGVLLADWAWGASSPEKWSSPG